MKEQTDHKEVIKRNPLFSNGRNKTLLRFTTAGSVDDGKSTLIGRLLYDSKSIFEDQMEHIIESGKRRGKQEVDLSLLTDGLKAEREQGITIDVAYRYFATPKRKFIIADTPGHIQYTRNMVTGASTADLAVILVDARNGVLEQTLRHSYIARLLDIRHIIFCINKMDLVDYSEDVFNKVKADLDKLVVKLDIDNPSFIPISAKKGDNVVDKSENMSWYTGKSFLNQLETVEIIKEKDVENQRFPVQYIIRPQSDKYHDYRGYAGRIAGGIFKPGDEIVVLPSMIKSKIKSVDILDKSFKESRIGDSVTITLDDNIDISRGDMIVGAGNIPNIGQDIEMIICWFNENPLRVKNKYVIRQITSEARCIIKSVDFKLNVNTLEEDYEDKSILMNDIARISVKTTQPLFYDDYKVNNTTGSVVIIDEATNETVAAGMIQANMP
ncbi:MAG: GTP-binding protein [Bacteroidales bacterium]|nr:GTP-binding protein [Bacteroidales bacterium]